MNELAALTLSEWWTVHHSRDEDLLALFWYAVDAIEYAARRGPGATVRRAGKVMWTVPEGDALPLIEICAISDRIRRNAPGR
jgi:hypothetical protein